MPRRSVESLALSSPTLTIPRLSPPATLGKERRAVWSAVVNALPAGWFSTDQASLLERYCNHVVRAREIESLLEKTDPAGDLQRYASLARLVALETRTMLSLARSMRLTQQSRANAITAARRALRVGSISRGVDALFEEE